MATVSKYKSLICCCALTLRQLGFLVAAATLHRHHGGSTALQGISDDDLRNLFALVSYSTIITVQISTGRVLHQFCGTVVVEKVHVYP